MLTTRCAGFGRSMSFTEELEVPPGFTMNFKDALRVVSEGVLIKLLVPKRAVGLTERFREVDRAFTELEVTLPLPRCSHIHVELCGHRGTWLR